MVSLGTWLLETIKQHICKHICMNMILNEFQAEMSNCMDKYKLASRYHFSNALIHQH